MHLKLVFTPTFTALVLNPIGLGATEPRTTWQGSCKDWWMKTVTTMSETLKPTREQYLTLPYKIVTPRSFSRRSINCCMEVTSVCLTPLRLTVGSSLYRIAGKFHPHAVNLGSKRFWWSILLSPSACATTILSWSLFILVSWKWEDGFAAIYMDKGKANQMISPFSLDSRGLTCLPALEVSYSFPLSEK